jgi:DNA-binding MarR family transcriptional regulator/Tfp pilus assembly protein PilF
VGLQTHLPIEILDYVQTHEPFEEVYGISQRELAKALGYHPCSMSRPLGELVAQGYLTSRRGLVRDGERRQLTYRLTPAGQNRLRQETGDVPLLSGEIPPPPNPFLGRKGELESLAGFWAGGASATIVDGPAGMGKTALVSRFLRRLKAERAQFWYTVRPASSARQFVASLAHALSFLGKPQLAYYAQLPRPPLPRECADLAARALETRPLAAVLDDVHLAGADLRAFLAEFVAALAARGDHRFFIVGQGALEFQLGPLAVHHLTVGGLDRTAAFELTNRKGGLSGRFESVYQSTLGSPLLLRLAVSRPEGAPESFDLPTTVVSQLKPSELRAIVPAAVSNAPLPASFLLEDRALTPQRLKDLGTIGILQIGLHDRVEVLQTIRSAILAKVEPGDERAAHRRLARFYGRSHRAETLRERFLHLVAGEEWKVAADLLGSHEREMLRLGYSEVFRGAIRTLVTALPQGPAKVRVYLTEATMLRQHADHNEAILSYRRAITHATGDGRVQKEALLGIVDLELKLGQLELAEQEFSRATSIPAVSRRLEAYVELTTARLAEARGERGEAEAGYQRAFEIGRKAHSQDIAFESIASWSKFAGMTRGPEVALEAVQAALPGARQSGRMDLVFNLRLVRARAYADLGRQDLAETEIEATRSEAESLGYLTQLTYALSGLAAVANERSQWSDSATYARQASDLAERLGNNLVLGHTLALLCASEFRQADQGGNIQLLYAAAEHGLRSIEVLQRIPPSDSLVLAHAYVTEVYLLMKRHADAVAHYDRTQSLAAELGLKAIGERIAEELGTKVDQSRLALERISHPPSSVPAIR